MAAAVPGAPAPSLQHSYQVHGNWVAEPQSQAWEGTKCCIECLLCCPQDATTRISQLESQLLSSEATVANLEEELERSKQEAHKRDRWGVGGQKRGKEGGARKACKWAAGCSGGAHKRHSWKGTRRENGGCRRPQGT
jgi:hypothetical protein